MATLSTFREGLVATDARVAQSVQELASLRDGVRSLADGMNRNPETPRALGTEAGETKPILPPSPGRIYEAAWGDYMAGRYEAAIDGFREVLRTYPNAPEAAESQFNIAESVRSQGQFLAAITEYEKLLKGYPASRRVAEAYYAEGLCYLELHKAADARRVFMTVVDRYPNTTQAYQAKQRLLQLSGAQ